MRYIIYGLVDPRNLKIRYIGQSSQGLKRPFQHWNSWTLKNNFDYCHNWIRKLISLELLPQVVILANLDAECKNLDLLSIKEKLNCAERELIEFYQQIGNHLTNMTAGGEGSLGRKVSEETKRKMSQKLKGRISPNKGKKLSVEQIEKIRERNKNWRPSQEIREKMSLAQLGRKHSLEVKNKISSKHKKQVLCLNDGKIFNSTGEAGKFYNISYTFIGMVCNGIKEQAKGLKFKFVNEKIRNSRLGKSTKAKKVKCLNDGKIFSSVRQAAANYNIAQSYVSLVCQNKKEQACGLNLIFLDREKE